MLGGARGWFLFKFFGRKNVKLLNGGLPKWIAEGRDTTSGEYQVENLPREQVLYNYKKQRSLVRDYDAIISTSNKLAATEPVGEVIVDVRPTPWFEGNPGPGDKPGGSIPGSINVFFMTLLNEDKTFKTPEEIRAIFNEKGGDLSGEKTSVCTCASGVTACIAMAALAHVGNHNTALYDGSWSEWLMKNPPS
jgi:thiosulfate/3-mercaptopyruvate sulfurtransferase